MNLPSQDLAEVVTALRDAGAVPAAALEQRRAVRMEVRASVVIWPVVAGTTAPARTVLTRDISCGGIGLLQGVENSPGHTFVLGLPRPRAAPLLVLCRSAFCAELADGLYSVGAEFVQVLGERRDKTAPGAAPAVAAATAA